MALIADADYTNELLVKDYKTGDIVKAVLNIYQRYNNQVAALANELKAETIFETCKNVWQYVKDNIAYIKDPDNNQWIKSPKRLVADKSGDCKSYSIFIASCLKCLHIPFSFRFVSFDPHNSLPTHVYIVVPYKGREIYVDAVLNEFNKQVPYQYKKDYMDGLYAMNGVPENATINGGVATVLNGPERKKLLFDNLEAIAMNFIYLYIPAGKWEWAPNAVKNYLEQVPGIIATKRNKAYKTSWDWGSWAGIKVENDLYPLLRQYITKQLGQSPEDFWNSVMNWSISRNDNGVFGIGSFTSTLNSASGTLSTVSTAASAAGGILSTVFGLFGSGNNTLQMTYSITEFAPDPSDWPQYQGATANLNPVNILQQKLNLQPTVVAAGNTNTGTTAYPIDNTNYSLPQSGSDAANKGYVYDVKNGVYVDPKTGASYDSSLQPITPYSNTGNGTTPTQMQSGFNNPFGWLLIAGGAAVVVQGLISRKKKSN